MITTHVRNRLLALAVPCTMTAWGGCAQIDGPGGVQERQDRLFLGGCARTAVVDDGEDNNPRILVHGDRGGYAYTFVDSNGSTVQPTPGSQGGSFSFEMGGANGSLYAARFHGRIGPTGIVYSGFGMNLREPKDLYDASDYEGVTFFARRAPGTLAKMRLKLPDRRTDPDGGVCSDCFNNFGKDIVLEEDWKQYVVPFKEMDQEPGWGSPRPAVVDAAHLYAIQFQVNTHGEEYDVWLDDIAFYGCYEKRRRGKQAGS